MYRKLYKGFTISTLISLAVILIMLIHSILYIKFSGLPLLETLLLPAFMFPYKLFVVFLFFASMLLQLTFKIKLSESR